MNTGTESISSVTVANVAKWITVDPVESFLKAELARQTKIADRAGERYQIEGRKRRPSVKRLRELIEDLHGPPPDMGPR